jgi:anti-sigma factor RsiW
VGFYMGATMNESDLDLLETYLDGELPMSEAEGLWRRLSAEPELSATLDDLRAQRALRLPVWEHLEPTDAATGVVARHITASVRRRRLTERSRRGLVYAASVAACLFIGIRIGWMEHGVSLQPESAPQSTSVAITDPSGTLVANPQFDTPQEASEFVNDLRNSSSAPPSRDLGDGVVPVSDERF